MVSCFLMLAYSFAFYKTLIGTRFLFIFVLIVLLMISNVGSIGIAISQLDIDESYRNNNKDERLYLGNAELCFLFMRDAGMNLAFWCFSFRYWKISYDMPVQLRGDQISVGFKVTSLVIFTLGLIFDIAIPSVYIYFAIYVGWYGGSDEEARRNSIQSQFKTFKYLMDLCQATSAVFMIWAVIRMKIISRRHRALREQANQLMIGMHLITMIVYLIFLTLHTVFLFTWITDD